MKTTMTNVSIRAWIWFFQFALQILSTFLFFSSGIVLLSSSTVRAFVSPDISPFKLYYGRYFLSVGTAKNVAHLSYPSYQKQGRDDFNEAEQATQIEGLLSEEDFRRLVAVDETIRALQSQLPTILTRALTPAMVEKAYSGENFCFSVLVDNDVGSTARGIGGGDVDIKQERSSKEDDEIVILNSRDELMTLSDVLVLTTAAAQQAILVTGTTDVRVKVECQLIIEESCRIIRIPWRAKAPTLGTMSATGSGNSFNNFEGITDCYLSTVDDIGKVERFIVRKASFNGRILNGPAIGQALKSIQSTLSNLQRNPILQNIVRRTQQSDDNDNRARSIFNTLRDEIFDQAATALSTSLSSTDAVRSDSKIPSKQNSEATDIPIYRVESISDLSLVANDGWIEDQIGTLDSSNASQQSPGGKFLTPCPGTRDWDKYVDSRSCLIRFSNNVIPQLSDLSIIDSKLFAEDVTYKMAADDSVSMTGRESLANFFQSMALTRKGTGGTWTMSRCEVLDWANRTIAISYDVTTNNLPLWTIQGRDVYILDTATSSDERPIIRSIRQGKMVAIGPNGNKLRLDGRWLTENVATAFQGDGSSTSSNLPRDFLTELLMNQPSLSPFLRLQKSSSKSKSSTVSNGKLPKSVAAASYYIMTDLYEQGISLFDLSSYDVRSPPGIEQMSENVELKGYLGEPIVRGLSLYKRSIGSAIFGIRESIRQNRLLVEEVSVPPRVELLVPTGQIRLSLTFSFRIPPPGTGILSPPDSGSIASGLPLKVELTSDYRIDPETGLITEHRLVETRVNGKLTAGDQISRWMQRFLKSDEATPSSLRNEDGALMAIVDAISWFRSI